MSETKLPQVGETWETTGWGVVTVKSISCGVWYCTDSGGARLSFGAPSSFVRRVLPGEETNDCPFLPGEIVTGTVYSDYTNTGAFICMAPKHGPDAVYVEPGDDWLARGCNGDPREELGGRRAVCMHTGSLRRLSAPTPSVPEPVATPTTKVDPYARHRLENADAVILQNMVSKEAYEAKRRRFTADTLRDLDRPILKLGGRFGRVVASGHPKHWPSNEGTDEP